MGGRDGPPRAAHLFLYVQTAARGDPDRKQRGTERAAAAACTSPKRARSSDGALAGALLLLLLASCVVSFAQGSRKLRATRSVRILGAHVRQLQRPRAALTTQAQSAVDARLKKDLDAIAGCVNVGMPALMNDHATLDIRQSAGVIGMVAKSQSSTRYIYTDGRKHPDAGEPRADDERSFHRPVGRRHARGRHGGPQRAGHYRDSWRRVPHPALAPGRAILACRLTAVTSPSRSRGPIRTCSAGRTYAFRIAKVPAISEPRVSNAFRTMPNARAS